MNQASHCAIGIDLGGTNCRFALVRPDGSLDGVERVGDTRELSAADLVALVAEHTDRLCRGAGGRGDTITGIGFVMPGFLSDDRTRVDIAANLPKLVGTDFPAKLRAACSLPITFDADCHAAGIAEASLGAGRNAQRLVVASIGTGIGASVLIDGNVLRFDRNGAGSLGHIVVAPDGPRCRCGRRGCLEAVAAGPPIQRDGIGSAAKHLAIGIATWSAIFRPDCVVFCGGVAEIGRALIDEIDRELSEIMPADRPALHISDFGSDAALVGAGVIALDAAGSSALPSTRRPSTIAR